MLNKEKLLKLFEYKDGILYRKTAPANCTTIGEKAGFITKKKYYKVKINQKAYFAHRLIFLMHHGFLPEFIDHIDGNPENNLIENLRPANFQQNNCNAKIRKDNLSGAKGVNWHKKQQKWNVRVGIGGKRKHIGSFEEFELAELVATMAREKYHGLFARHH
jgi:hypothetical protein